MTKRILSVALVLSVLSLALVVSCSSGSSGSSGTSYKAPTVSSAGDLPATAGTAPTTDAAALSMFKAVGTSFSSTLDANATETLKSIVRSKGVTDTVTDGPYAISWTTSSASGGAVSITGTRISTVTKPNSTWTPAVGTYKDIYGSTENYDVAGTVSGITLTGTEGGVSHTYVVSGDYKNKYDTSVAVDVKIASLTASGVSYVLNFDYGISTGIAFSVKRDDGVGAKFVLTFGGTVSLSNVSLTSNDSSVYEAQIQSQLAKNPVTLTVYNDQNAVVLTEKMTLADMMTLSN